MNLIHIFSSTKTVNIYHTYPKKRGKLMFFSKVPLYPDDPRVTNKKE